MPRELWKYGWTAPVELYWRAGNANMRGEAPTVCPQEWSGAVAGYIPKNLSALLMLEFRPIACICTKFVYVLSFQTQRLTVEDSMIDDSQKAFRRGTSTKPQLGKLYSILVEQCRRKASLSVILYLDWLDIKNTTNAVNHRLAFISWKLRVSQTKTSPYFDECTMARFWS